MRLWPTLIQMGRNKENNTVPEVEKHNKLLVSSFFFHLFFLENEALKGRIEVLFSLYLIYDTEYRIGSLWGYERAPTGDQCGTTDLWGQRTDL